MIVIRRWFSIMKDRRSIALSRVAARSLAHLVTPFSAHSFSAHSLFAYSLSRSLTFSLTRSLFRPLTFSRTHSLSRPLTFPLTHPPVHTFSRSLTHSLSGSFTHSPAHSLNFPFAHFLVPSVINSLHLTLSLSHSLICSLTS